MDACRNSIETWNTQICKSDVKLFFPQMRQMLLLKIINWLYRLRNLLIIIKNPSIFSQNMAVFLKECVFMMKIIIADFKIVWMCMCMYIYCTYVFQTQICVHAKSQHVPLFQLILNLLSYAFFIHGFSLNMQLTDSPKLAAQQAPRRPISTSLVLGLQLNTTTPVFQVLVEYPGSDAHAFQLKHLPRSPAPYLPFQICKHFTWCLKPNTNHAASQTRIKSNSWVSKYSNIQDEGIQVSPLNSFMPKPIATIQTVSKS